MNMHTDHQLCTLSACLVTMLLLSSCRKEECISCIAETPQGILLDQEIGCSEEKGYADGFEEGFRQRFIDEGVAANVNCERYQRR